MEYLVTSSLPFAGIEARTIAALEQRGFVVRSTSSLVSAAGGQPGASDASPGFSVLLLYDPEAEHQTVWLITFYERGGQTVIRPATTRPMDGAHSPAGEDANAELVTALVSGGLALRVDVRDRGICTQSSLNDTITGKPCGMNPYRLPDDSQIGHASLTVSNLDRALAFYRDLLGFQSVSEAGDIATLSATGSPPIHLMLRQHPQAARKPRGTTGLYHIAIRYPERQALALAFRRLVEQPWRFQGASDHLVSEALYLADPDGNGLELYVDRPRHEWRRTEGQIAMATEPLDIESLVAEAGEQSWKGIHPGVDIGHVHLHVSDLDRAEAFYGGVLGFDVTQRTYPGALFLSAGGYHHHLGLNVWAGVGAPSPPPNAVGLTSFGLLLPDQESLDTLTARATAAGATMDDHQRARQGFGVWLRDPDGIGVELLVSGNHSISEATDVKSEPSRLVEEIQRHA